MSQRQTSLAVVIFGAILVSNTGCHTSRTTTAGAAQSIVGAWVVVPTAPNRPRGLPNCFTFTSDGTITRFSPADNGGTGTWMETGDRTVTYTFIAINRGATGDFSGTIKVRGRVTLNANYSEFSGGGKVDFFDAQGRLTQSGEFTTHATRIMVESP